MLFFARIDAWRDVLKEFFHNKRSFAIVTLSPDSFSGAERTAVLLNETASKLRSQHLDAALHENPPLWAGLAARHTLYVSINQFPLLFQHNSATVNPFYGSNTESELEHADNGIIISNFSI